MCLRPPAVWAEFSDSGKAGSGRSWRQALPGQCGLCQLGQRPGPRTVCLLLPAPADNPILLSTENGLLTVPLGPSEARNMDTLDKLQQAVGEGKVEAGRGGGEHCCCCGPDSMLTLPPSHPRR